MNSEKNIEFYNKDILRGGSYVYTDENLYAAFIANQRQSGEVIKSIKRNFRSGIKILDIGCGDGKYTIEIFKKLRIKAIVGVDPAKEAISIAKKRINSKDKRSIGFVVDNIYRLDFLYGRENYDLALVKGVLHHLYYPQKAVKNLCKHFDYILILEPNGYNPILKVIERMSSYHRQHEEKSYKPTTVNRWFADEGFVKVEQYVFGLVPYFCPKKVAVLLKRFEPIVEKIPILRELLCGSYLFLYKKDKKIILS